MKQVKCLSGVCVDRDMDGLRKSHPCGGLYQFYGALLLGSLLASHLALSGFDSAFGLSHILPCVSTHPSMRAHLFLAKMDFQRRGLSVG